MSERLPGSTSSLTVILLPGLAPWAVAAGAQLYAGGELVGGCDIVEEMAAAGVLREELDEMAART
jgi:glutaredoxin-related protein